MSGGTPLVSVRDLRTHYTDRQWLLDRMRGRRPGALRAVDGVDLDVARGEAVCLVGESGSGKTTLGRAALRLAPVTSGRVVFDGRDITDLRGRALRRLRTRMQLIPQDPLGSLSPRLRVRALLTEPYRIHGIPADRRQPVADLLDMVELPPAMAEKFPHELSGGQARRVGIARALALRPDFVVADEPTAGLDVSAAAKILTLLRSLRASHGLTYLIITHNLRIVDFVADRLAVMYLGRLAEIGPVGQVLDLPAHPYTRALLDAVPEPDPRLRAERGRLLLPGEIGSPRNPPPGCSFHPRCRYASPQACTASAPQLSDVEPDHRVACHFWPDVRRDTAGVAGTVGGTDAAGRTDAADTEGAR